MQEDEINESQLLEGKILCICNNFGFGLSRILVKKLAIHELVGIQMFNQVLFLNL